MKKRAQHMTLVLLRPFPARDASLLLKEETLSNKLDQGGFQ